MSGVMAISEQVIEEILRDCAGPDDLFGEAGVLAELQRKILARAQHCFASNGAYAAPLSAAVTPTVVTSMSLREDVRESILSLYARGRDAQSILRHMAECGDASLVLADVQHVIERVWSEYGAWQARELQDIYPVIYLDDYPVHVRVQSRIESFRVQCAIGLDTQGRRDVLGFWPVRAELAHDWGDALHALTRRGVRDCVLLCVEHTNGGIKTLAQQVWPQVELQLCPARMLRNTLKHVDWRDRKSVHDDVRQLLMTPSQVQAYSALPAFAQRWEHRYPGVSELWRSHAAEFLQFYDYVFPVRNLLHGMGIVELLHSCFAKFDEASHPFVDERELLQRFYVGYLMIARKWSAPLHEWRIGAFDFTQRYPGRFSLI
jgi:putative transposase